MKDLLLNADGDVVLTDGELQLVENSEEIAQQVRVELSTFKGEWFLDLGMGVDYYGRVLGKGHSFESIRAELIAAILRVPGMQRVDRMDFTLDHVSRQLTVSYSATTRSGAAVTRNEVLNSA